MQQKLSDREDPWASATWEGAARGHLLAGARLTMAEKLAWLEDTGRLAERFARDRRPGSSKDRPSGSLS